MNQSAKRAINLMGGRKSVAARFCISYEAVRKWEESGVPMRRCADVVRELRGQMTVRDFYPEFYDGLDQAAV